MDGLDVVGDILKKISVNCVINLHVALLFTCLFLWVYPMLSPNIGSLPLNWGILD